jgi:selenocysteine lyase/cysteine desulfurase
MAPAQDALRRFLTTHPDYDRTRPLDDLRATEFARLDRDGHVYVDYTGAGLHAASHVRSHAELLSAEVFGNPHSGSPCSEAATRLVERTRRRILTYFNADPNLYTVVFTANASAALKLVGEAYPFTPDGRLLLTFDNHNSANGIREYAWARGAAVEYVPLTTPDLRIDLARLDSMLTLTAPGNSLFVFPAQSNFSGVKHPLDLIDRAHDHGWDVLVDTAAFVGTNRLDLSAAQPDFAVVSFYKMFGYPTGVGCLLARRSSLARLKRPWFAGGTVRFASVQGHAHVLAGGEAGFEDGTLNYLAIPAVDWGLDLLDRIGVPLIQARVEWLTGYLLEQLLALRHANGRPMVRIYGPANTFMRGGTVTFNLHDPDGHLIDYRRVEELAGAERISLRTGCFCNPGAGEMAEGLTAADMLAGVEAGPDISLPRFRQIIQHRSGKSAGALRVSLGLVSNFADAHRVVTFLAGLRDQTRLAVGEVTFDIEACRVIRDGS